MDNPLFTIDPGLFIWSIIIFLLVLFILKRYAWTPLLNFIDERETEISDSLAMAESAKADLEQVREESEKILNEAKNQSKSIVSDGKQRAEQSANTILNDAKQKSDEFVLDAKKKIDVEKKRAIKDIKEEYISKCIYIKCFAQKEELTYLKLIINCKGLGLFHNLICRSYLMYFKL